MRIDGDTLRLDIDYLDVAIDDYPAVLILIASKFMHVLQVDT